MKLTNAILELLPQSSNKVTLVDKELGSYTFSVDAYKGGLLRLIYFEKSLCDSTQKGPLYIGFNISFNWKEPDDLRDTEFRQLFYCGVLDREISPWQGDFLLDSINPHSMLNWRVWRRVAQVGVRKAGLHWRYPV